MDRAQVKYPKDFKEGDAILVVGRGWVSLEYVVRATP